MKTVPTASLVLFGFLLGTPLGSEPTEVREWRSTAGTTIEASATKVENGQVFVKAGDGREFKVPLDKFVEEDRAFLAEHFSIKAPEPGQATASGVALVEGGLAYPLGEVSGPIDAGEGSHYFVYVPKTLREGRKAPLMLVTGAGGGNNRAAAMYAEGAEVAGWVLAASVESRNGPDHPEGNHAHAKRCVAHLIGNLPIDEGRVYFTGNSGGGAMSFYNGLRIESAGNMPVVGYSPDKKYDKKRYCYGIGGTKDFNRYLTAHAVAQFKERGVHRLHAGGHSGGPAWIGAEGIVWLGGLDDVLARLPRKSRNALVARYLTGKTTREIALELGVRENTVAVRIHSGIRRLRACLAARGVRVSGGLLIVLLGKEAAAAAPVAVSG